MEKAPLFRGYGEHGGIRDQSYRAWLDRRIHLRSVGRIWLLGVALLLTFVFREELKISILFNESMRGTKPSDWNDITPTSNLIFYPCFDSYECARLDVPLDWTASESSKKTKRAAIALTKIPAQVPVTDPRYGGAILINPGGPGGSGVNAVAQFGQAVQKIVDAPRDPKVTNKGKYFDVIGFDPRGINNTTPRTTCFPDDGAREVWNVAKDAQGLPSNETFGYVWGRAVGFSKSCSKRMDEEDDHVGRYVNTAVVVEDMVAIVEALGEWREKKGQEEAKRLHGSQRAAALDRTKWRKGQEKFLYWGFSYGTILGATLASMHPDRLERMAMDGVADAEDYYKGYWLTNLQDTDLIIDKFHEDCYAAGPDKCALWNPLGPEHSQHVFNRVLKRLQTSPLPVSASGSHGPDLITYTDLMLLIRSALYSPRFWFPLLARVFADIDLGNGTEFAAFKQNQLRGFCRSPLCNKNPWNSDCHDPLQAAMESGRAIMCSDAPDRTDWTEEDHFKKYLTLMEQSKYLGASWSEITMYCANWNVRPAWPYTPSLEGNTSIPILWISNTRDTVTPLRNAIKMAKGFPGSVVLKQDADGHCSLAAPSLCTALHIRQYFQEGKLPPEDVMCIPDWGTFDGEERDLRPLQTLTMEERKLSDALNRLSRGFGTDGPLGIL